MLLSNYYILIYGGGLEFGIGNFFSRLRDYLEARLDQVVSQLLDGVGGSSRLDSFIVHTDEDAGLALDENNSGGSL